MEYSATTFSFPTGLSWKFKYYVTSKRLRIRAVTSDLVKHYMEEEEDNRSYEKTMKIIRESEKEDYIEWTEYKRRNQLDGIQSSTE